MAWQANVHAEGSTRVKHPAHAKEEGMRGTHARRPSQDRVRFW
jgi:hypothetical protein